MAMDDPVEGVVNVRDASGNVAGVTATGRLQTETITKPDGLTATLTTHTTAVTTAGTPVALSATAFPVWRVDIVARPTNTGRICVGDSTVNASTLRVAELKAGESYCLQCPQGARLDLAGVFIDASVNGDGVYFNAFAVAVAS